MFGVVLATTGSFNGALVFIAAIAIIGALSYLFLVGKTHRLELSDD